jgi:peptidoglycan/LPS O-acetylase OafA/YrhL
MSEHEGFAEPAGRDKGRSPNAALPAAPARPNLHLAYLDGLRALAAVYVVMFHAVLGFSGQNLTGSLRLLRRAFAFGHEAVAIFIVLSGYCLMLPVVRRTPDRLQVAFLPFMRRRALRILPPYFVALGGSLLLMAGVPALGVRGSGTIWDDSFPGFERGAILSHLLLVHNWSPLWSVQINGPLWSVATEWQIYFCFPLLLLPLWQRWGMFAALLGALLVGYAPLLLAPAAAQSAIPWYLVLFELGMLAAALGFWPDARCARWRARAPWGAITAAAWAACALLSNALAGFWFSHKPLTDLLVGLATATLLVRLTSRAAQLGAARGLLLRLLETRSLVLLGHFSYSLYLTHLPVVALCCFALRPLGLSAGAFTLWLALLGGAASLLVAYAFHRAVERPFMLRR